MPAAILRALGTPAFRRSDVSLVRRRKARVVRKNDRIDHNGIVHVVAQGSKWYENASPMYGAVYVCGLGYRSRFRPDGTCKKGPSCLWCVARRSRH